MRSVSPLPLSKNSQVGGSLSLVPAASNALWVALSAGVLVYAVYLAAKPVQWSDSGFFVAEIVAGERLLEGPLEHPAYRLVASVVYGLGGIRGFFALNAIANAFSSYFIFRMARSLGASSASAWIGAAAFFMCQPVFWLAVNAEVYPLHNAVLMLGTFILLRGLAPTGVAHWGRFAAGTGLIAISILFHQLSVLVLPVVALLALQALRPQLAQATRKVPLALLIGLGVALALTLTAALIVTGAADWVSAYLGLSGPGERWSSRYFNVFAVLRDAKYIVLALYGIGWLGLALLLSARGDRRLLFLKLAALLQLAFVLTYDVPDRAFFLLPALSFLSVLFAVFLDRIPRTVWLPLGALAIVSHAIVGVLTQSGALPEALFPQRDNANPYRNSVAFYLGPYLKETSAQAFADDLYAIASRHPGKVTTLIADDWTPLGAVVSARSTGYPRTIQTIMMKELKFDSSGCPLSSGDRLYVVFRRTDLIPLGDGCVSRVGRLLTVRE
jgi:hypothetical protein